MTTNYGDDYVNLTDHVRRLDSRLGKDDASALALALLDIRDECKSYGDSLLPSVLAAQSEEQLAAAIFDVRESLRHIAYHINDAQQFRDVLPLDPDAPVSLR